MRCHPLSVLSTLAAVLLGGFATPLAPRWGRMRVIHAWNAVPKNWESQGYPHNKTTIDLYLALKSHREDALIDALYKVSNPWDPQYGAHLTKEQVAELVAPHPDTLELVSSWLEHYDIPSTSISTTLGGNWLAVVGVSVSQANDILGASYQLYQHAVTNDTILRTISYSLPEALDGHIETVVPTTYFGSPLTEGMRQWMSPSAPAEARGRSGSGELVTVLSSREVRVMPSDLRSLYKLETYVPAAADRNVFGIAGYDDNYPSPQDLKSFMETYRTEGVDATYTVEYVNGGKYDPNNPSVEGNLNIQYAEALAYPTRHIYYTTAGTPNSLTDDPYIRWIRYLLEKTNIPQTISTSYGGVEQVLAPGYMNSICRLFAQLGARGVSILFASGDHGVGEGDCMVKDSSGEIYTEFLPTFPATCPYVTSVGGTTGGMTEDSSEVAAHISGGGFSTYFPREPYQTRSVRTFLQNLGDTYEDLYNLDGRGFPDISAQAIGFFIILKGERRVIDGTSGSTPIVAAIISLLNDYLISKGQDPLGFLNPWLYTYGLDGFNDITSGSNPGCNTDGFSAIPGWDPVTGLGTPDF
ncbi:subtilisin-like protein [Lactarius psammicola]|nr:subtilisin-like protein [Lactarius psammicola]